jgi:hypothetical protein
MNSCSQQHGDIFVPESTVANTSNSVTSEAITNIRILNQKLKEKKNSKGSKEWLGPRASCAWWGGNDRKWFLERFGLIWLKCNHLLSYLRAQTYPVVLIRMMMLFPTEADPAFNFVSHSGVSSATGTMTTKEFWCYLQVEVDSRRREKYITCQPGTNLKNVECARLAVAQWFKSIRKGKGTHWTPNDWVDLEN